MERLMPSDLPQFTIRIDPILLRKIRYVAECSDRSANKEVERLIREHVAKFERENGKIKLPVEDG
jgi:hypothetical protein